MLQDTFGRKIEYLRVSLTDKCNYRCIYCMPEEGVCSLPHSQILSLEENAEIIRAFAELGVKKVRITGGEPLVRKGLLTFVRAVGSIPGIQELSITTNGALLAPVAQDLYDAGVKRINISLDTLKPERFSFITRGGQLSDTLAGMEAAEKAGMQPIKLNSVLIGGFNDDEIEDLVNLTVDHPYSVRFIELMPIGHTVPFGQEAYIPDSTVLERVPTLMPIEADGGVARRYALPGARGTVGLISPVSSHFCAECNRIRLTSDGKLKPCLHSADEIPIRGLHGDELKQAIIDAVNRKPQRHVDLSATQRSESVRNMNAIGG